MGQAVRTDSGLRLAEMGAQMNGFGAGLVEERGRLGKPNGENREECHGSLGSLAAWQGIKLLVTIMLEQDLRQFQVNKGG